MLDPKGLSKMIRDKKKNVLRQDMDYAGQDAIDPNEALDLKTAAEINDTLGEQDHEPASASEMGENESSQEKKALKASSTRIAKYMKGL